MKCTINIDLDNDSVDLVHILDNLSETIDSRDVVGSLKDAGDCGEYSQAIFDDNGNRVGELRIYCEATQ